MSRRVANLEAKDQTAVWATEYGVEVSHYRFAAIKPPFIGRAPTTLAHVLQIAAGSDETCNLRGLHVGLHRYWSKLYGRMIPRCPSTAVSVTDLATSARPTRSTGSHYGMIIPVSAVGP